MTQDECLAQSSHFTYLGVCYPGSVAYVNLSSPQNPQPVHFTTNAPHGVPEPALSTMFALAAIFAWVFTRRPRCRYRSH